MTKTRGKSNQPKISVVVAVYNREATLRQCLVSITSQTFKDYELIVVDGGSSDGSVDIIQSFASQIEYWSSERDKGIYDAWNKALSQAKGEWVCFIGSDDYLTSNDVLADISQNLDSFGDEIDFVYSNIVMVNNAGDELFKTGEPWEHAIKGLMRGMPVPHPAMMHRRSVFQRHGTFDDSFRIAGDYDLFLRSASSKNVRYLPNVLAVSMRQGGISSEVSNYRTSILERWKAQRKKGLKVPRPMWFVDLVAAELRTFLFLALGEARTRTLVDFIRKRMGLEPYWSRL